MVAGSDWWISIRSVDNMVRCCSFLSVEEKKELNKLLSQTKRKAGKMEQQLQKSKVTTCSCFCYFPNVEKRMMASASLQNLNTCVVRAGHLHSFMIDNENHAVTVFFFFQNRRRFKVSSLRQSLVSVHVNIFCTSCGHIAFLD